MADEYPDMAESVTVPARVVAVYKNDDPARRQLSLQLGDGQNLITNLGNITRNQAAPEAKSVTAPPENKRVSGPPEAKAKR